MPLGATLMRVHEMYVFFSTLSVVDISVNLQFDFLFLFMVWGFAPYRELCTFTQKYTFDVSFEYCFQTHHCQLCICNATC